MLYNSGQGHPGSQQSSQLGKNATNQFDARMDRLLLAANVRTPSDFAKILGIKQQSVSSARARKQLPLTWVAEISERYNISADWLLYGTGQMHRGEDVPASSPLEQCLDAERYRLVPLLESRVTAGPEGEILYEEAADYLPFKRWWLEKMVGRGEHRLKRLVLVRVRGDSMSPTINQGEIALVDTDESERVQILDARIYLVVTPDGAVTIKRVILKKDNGQIKLLCLSDNTASYRPTSFDLAPSHQLKEYVLGRVRWVGKEFD